jgi:hypothetical protein
MGPTPASSHNLHIILSMIDSCDTHQRVSVKKKIEIFKKFIGAIIHDFHSFGEGRRGEWQAKWVWFISDAYTIVNKKVLCTILNVGSLRATNDSRIAGVAQNVQKYLNNELVVEDEDESENESDSD